ncbi:DUF6586 family protein [Marinobacter sp. SS21]|uniref:DUF6586 family protein n=1 Tax=Marinobacter sp. SS21 TaxID=2979460 RepID=UPI00232E0E1D|nr:DUF6586 family protein [Marinobacter sp. SS21]MDC0662181.1 hypothetical protein [Marinobacter sp. SS21]
MASQWHTQISQKLYLAKTLLAHRETTSNPAEQEAASQGAIELILRARVMVLTLIAELYQHKGTTPSNLANLTTLIGPDAPEAVELESLTRQPANWWSQLDQLDRALGQPPAKKKSVSDDNIIAVSVDTGPDRSTAMLQNIITAMKLYADSIAERHQEW